MSRATWKVRVPTHENGTCLFWEFATDNHDIGFGVYFEWTISPSNMVSVHVSDSSDEEEFEEEEERIGNDLLTLVHLSFQHPLTLTSLCMVAIVPSYVQ